MKATLTALTLAVSLIASGASAFDPADLQKLLKTGRCVGCDLRGAILGQTNLAAFDLSGADLYEANLQGGRLIETVLRGTKLQRADLSGANLSGADLSYAIMNGAILCNTTMPDDSVIYSGC